MVTPDGLPVLMLIIFRQKLPQHQGSHLSACLLQPHGIFADGLRWSKFNCVGEKGKSCMRFSPVFSLLCLIYTLHLLLLIKEGDLFILLVNYLLN